VFSRSFINFLFFKHICKNEVFANTVTVASNFFPDQLSSTATNALPDCAPSRRACVESAILKCIAEAQWLSHDISNQWLRFV